MLLCLFRALIDPCTASNSFKQFVLSLIKRRKNYSLAYFLTNLLNIPNSTPVLKQSDSAGSDAQKSSGVQITGNSWRRAMSMRNSPNKSGAGRRALPTTTPPTHHCPSFGGYPSPLATSMIIRCLLAYAVIGSWLMLQSLKIPSGPRH